MALVDADKPQSPVVQAAQLVLVVVAMMWVIEAVDRFLLSSRLEQQGIVARSLGGLDGILWAPFLHGSFGHILANTLPFVVLGLFIALEGPRRLLAVSAIVIGLGGAATWLFARPESVHIGASGLIFGYAGFLLVAGFVEKSIRGIGVALIVGVLFGGMVLRGITPVSSFVSWESHLFGLVAGVLAAFALATPESERLEI